jgi:hypothetical protein
LIPLLKLPACRDATSDKVARYFGNFVADYVVANNKNKKSTPSPKRNKIQKGGMLQKMIDYDLLSIVNTDEKKLKSAVKD